MSRVLILSEAEVESLLPMSECIGVMEQALTALAAGEVSQPLRSKLQPAGAPGLLGLMPSWWGGEKPYFGLKEVCVFPGNPARGLHTHVGAVLLHSGETGELLAVVNASAVTAIRTAAVSAVATRLLAREDASKLAIIGAGVQGRKHLEAIPLVRDIRQVKVYSRSGVGIQSLRPRASGEEGGGRADEGAFSRDQSVLTRRFAPPSPASGRGHTLPVETASSVEEAVRDADIIVTATSSREPILRREWIRPGAHINAVGSSIPVARELDGATVAASSLFVDRWESTVNESGDYLFAVREGAISGPEHIRGEIGDLLTGRGEGRKSEEEITLFESLGLGIEDLASAAFVFEKAHRLGSGTWVEF